MGRALNPNKSYYHIVLEDHTDKNNVKYEYYMTTKEVSRRLNASKFTINRSLNDYDFTTNKYKDIKLRRCYIPTQQTYTKMLSKDELDEMRVELLV